MSFKIGLVLGGGGARGMAHVGVIKVLEREGIQADIICGTSMGALVGGVYAQQSSAALLEQKVLEFVHGPRFIEMGVDNFRNKRERDPDDVLSQLTRKVKRRLVINLAANRLALLKMDRLQVAVDELLNEDVIEACKKPFACVAADLNSGDEVVFSKGPIRKAVAASSAIPGFLPPVEYNGNYLIDGSVVNNFPVDVARGMGADFVILVDVSLQFEENNPVDNVIDLVMRSGQITNRKLNEVLARQADFCIAPDIGDVHWSEFNRIDDLIDRGEKIAQAMIPELKKTIKRRKNPIRNFWKRFLQ